MSAKTPLFAGAIAIALLSLATLLPGSSVFAVGSAQAVEIPPVAAPAMAPGASRSESVIFAGGCFWGVQGVFQHIDGVSSAVSGYAGGSSADANYGAVSSGRTGHAEAVKVTYDPSKVSYAQLLQVYFSVVHDPTQLDRQGPDRGTQYRSAVFVDDPRQSEMTRRYIAQLDQAHVFGAPIVTRLEAGKTFYPAEAYHQDYLVLNPSQPYIRVHDLPKVAELKRVFPKLYRDEPVLVSAR